ncbi:MULTISPECIES: hypothetical protein [Nocardiaceae]|uniref:hypothetical protein n=1 Tax=Nocardiaceae TaxID=85025 RepID=UPI000A7D160A|nr:MULTISPECIES: hypothetical protein [Rhodococcus]
MDPERQCAKTFLILLAEPTKALKRRSERHAVSIAQQAITPTKPNLDVWILLVIFLPFA